MQVQTILALLEASDSQLEELHHTLGQEDVAARNKTLTGELRLLAERMISRLALLRDKIEAPIPKGEGGHWAPRTRYVNERGEAVALDSGGNLLFRPRIGAWQCIQKNATETDLSDHLKEHPGKWVKHYGVENDLGKEAA